MVSSHNDLWVTCTRPNPQARLRLFGFPHSGASAAMFYGWADSLPPSVELCAVQYPGHGTRLSEPPITRIQSMVRQASSFFLPYLDLPFAFFGHSMGALVSFELARYLRRTHEQMPAHMVVSGHTAPQIRGDNSPIHQLPEPIFVEELRKLNGTPEEVLDHPELRQLLLPILRADFAACETYVYEPDAPLECSLSAYGGLTDSHVSRDALEAWSEQATGGFSLRMFPGDHFYLNTHRSLLLQTLARELDEVARRLS